MLKSVVFLKKIDIFLPKDVESWHTLTKSIRTISFSSFFIQLGISIFIFMVVAILKPGFFKCFL